MPAHPLFDRAPTPTPTHPFLKGAQQREGFKYGPGTNRSLGHSGPPGRSRLGGAFSPIATLSPPPPRSDRGAHWDTRTHTHTHQPKNGQNILQHVCFSRLPPNFSRLPPTFSRLLAAVRLRTARGASGRANRVGFWQPVLANNPRGSPRNFCKTGRANRAGFWQPVLAKTHSSKTSR
jgi:hypothetical protein